MTESLQVAIPLFPKFTALDGVGPYEVLQRIPSVDVTFIGQHRGEYRSENGMLGLGRRCLQRDRHGPAKRPNTDVLSPMEEPLA
jgi:putative intracellular protease/amidase